MDISRRLLTEITQLTSTIETEHPELYQFLDENPITLPDAPHPEIGEELLKDYLDSLQQLLKHHLEKHQNKNRMD